MHCDAGGEIDIDAENKLLSSLLVGYQQGVVEKKEISVTRQQVSKILDDADIARH